MDETKFTCHDKDMKRIVVLNVVGLSKSLLPQMAKLNAWVGSQKLQSFKPSFPAVTCTAQSTYITGLDTAQHGIVGNGWYNREASEVQFWKQSNKLVRGPRIWELLQEKYGKDFTCAKLFWWYNMYSTANWTMTPRPMYPADGRKIFDIYTQPMGLRAEVTSALGKFPFPYFWGPMADIPSTRWIARAAMWTEQAHRPNLSLVYLPHLDYDLQRFCKNSSKALAQLDTLLDELINFYNEREVEIIILSEYGISPVTQPIALNRIFRQQGWITIKEERGTEMLDCGASRAFAVADHQVAHIYINDASIREEVKQLLLNTQGVDELREPAQEWGESIGTQRAGDFIAIASPHAWFSYYYWDDDNKAPDFAPCIDIHRKPGYDPAELFFDPALRAPKLKAACFLAKKILGFRALMKVIALNGDQVKGSHGRDIVPKDEAPVFIGSHALPDIHSAQDVHQAILAAFEQE